jgi:hypothetical protein
MSSGTLKLHTGGATAGIRLAAQPGEGRCSGRQQEHQADRQKPGLRAPAGAPGRQTEAWAQGASRSTRQTDRSLGSGCQQEHRADKSLSARATEDGMAGRVFWKVWSSHTDRSPGTLSCFWDFLPSGSARVEQQLPQHTAASMAALITEMSVLCMATK